MPRLTDLLGFLLLSLIATNVRYFLLTEFAARDARCMCMLFAGRLEAWLPPTSGATGAPFTRKFSNLAAPAIHRGLAPTRRR